MNKVYLALGSNIEPEKNIPAAVAALEKAFRKILAQSSLWQTPAVGSEGPDFLNMVVLVESERSPAALKHEVLRPIEAELGRVRVTDKNAPRTIDLDVLVWDGEVMEAELWEMAHLAVPMAELCPEFAHPETGENLDEIAGRFRGSIKKI